MYIKKDFDKENPKLFANIMIFTRKYGGKLLKIKLDPIFVFAKIKIKIIIK